MDVVLSTSLSSSSQRSALSSSSTLSQHYQYRVYHRSIRLNIDHNYGKRLLRTLFELIRNGFHMIMSFCSSFVFVPLLEDSWSLIHVSIGLLVVEHVFGSQWLKEFWGHLVSSPILVQTVALPLSTPSPSAGGNYSLNIPLFCQNEDSSTYLCADHVENHYDNNQDIVDQSDVIFLCVLPDQTSEVLQNIKFDSEKHTLVSLVVGFYLILFCFVKTLIRFVRHARSSSHSI